MFGNMIGCFFWGFIADAYGRLRTIFATVVLVCLFSFLTEFSDSYNSFAILRFGTGFALAGHGIIALQAVYQRYANLSLFFSRNSYFCIGN